MYIKYKTHRPTAYMQHNQLNKKIPCDMEVALQGPEIYEIF